MVEVVMTPNALEEFGKLPKLIQIRVREVMTRLSRWPAVRGAKPLHRESAGSFRIRAGDYRVVFTSKGNKIIIKVGYRGGIYD